MAHGFTVQGGLGAGGSIIPHESSADSVLVPDTELLFTAQFHRAGPDLVLTGRDGQHHLIPGYFSSEHHPALVAPNGAHLSPDTVDLLAGSATPGHYAQAQPTAPPDSIGKIEKVVGDVTVMRNGATVALHVGDAVFKTDVVQTGASSSCGISFPDGTALNLVANTRMALNDYTYDANSNANGALFTLVEGTFAFVAGKVAHTGDMKIATPVATMGIRGTTGVVEEVATISAQAAGHTYTFAVVPDIGTGVTGMWDVFLTDANGVIQRDANGNPIVLVTVSQSGYVTYLTPQGLGQPPLVSTEPATNSQYAFEQEMLQQLFLTLNPLNQPNGNNGSSTPPPPFELPNPIPQLFPGNGNPIPINVPNGTNPTTPTIIDITVGPTGPLTVVIWIVSAPGKWSTGSNWLGGAQPTSPQEVEILVPVKVTADGDDSAAGLVIVGGATVNIISGATLTILDYIHGGGTVQLNSSGADPTLAIDGAVTLVGGGTINMIGAPGEDYILGVPGTGALLLNIDYTIEGTGTIGGGDGNLTFENFGIVNANDGLLTVNTGNQVYNDGLMEATVDPLAATVGTLQIKDSVVNAGTVQADGAGTAVTLSGATFDNLFSVVAKNGGSVTFTNVAVTNEAISTTDPVGGTINANGGTIAFDGGSIANGNLLEATNGGTLQLENITVTNSSAATATVDATSTLDLMSAAIHGGTIENDGNVFVTAGASVLHGDSVTNTGTMIVEAGASLTLEGDTTLINEGSAALIKADGGTVAIELDTDTNVNSGTIEAVNGGKVDFYINVQGGSNQGLIEAGAGGTVHFFQTHDGGGGGGGAQGGNYGTMEAADGGVLIFDGGLDNFNLLEAVNGGTVDLSNGAHNHAGGTILATGGGIVTIDSGLSNEATATVEADDSASQVNINGVVDNLGTIQATGAGAQVDLANGNFDNEVGGLIEADTGGTITLDSTLNGGTNVGTIEAGIGGTIVIDSFGGNGLFNFDDNGDIGTIEAIGIGAKVELSGATIIGGYLGSSNGGVFETVSGTSTLMNVILTGGTFRIDSGTILDLNGGSNGVAAYIDGTVTMNGAGKVEMDATSYSIRGGVSNGTLDNQTTIEGQGTIGTGDTPLPGVLTLVNSGTIEAAGGEFVINTGTRNSATTANSGTLEANGVNAVLLIDFTNMNNAGGTIAALNGADAISATASVVELLDDNIVGGTLQTSNFGTIETITNNGAATTTVFDGVTNQGYVYVSDDTTLLLRNTIDNTGGKIALALTGKADLQIDGTVTLENGEVELNTPLDKITALAAGATLDNTADIHGQGEIGSGDGNLTLDNLVGGTIDATGILIINTGENIVQNCGLIEAIVNGGVLTIESAVDNAGTIKADGGGAIVTLSAGVANYGTIEAITGGIVGIEAYSGTIDNYGTMKADGGQLQLYDQVQSTNVTNHAGGVIEALDHGVVSITVVGGASNLAGGLIEADGGDVTFLVPGGLTNAANATIEALDGGILSFTNVATTFDNAGTVSLDDGTLALEFNMTLDGGGVVTLSDDCRNAIGSFGVPVTFTNVDNTISGAGTIGDAYLTLINERLGVIDADDCKALILDTGANTVTNQGTLEATLGGTLDIYSAIDNESSGVILATGAGSTVAITYNGGGPNNCGLEEAVAGGTLNLTDDSGGVGNNSGGTIKADAGTVSITGGVDNNGTIEAVDGGTLTINIDNLNNNNGGVGNFGTIDADGGTVSIIATVSDAVVLNSGAGTIEAVDGGTVSIAANLTNESGGVISATGGGSSVTIDPAQVDNCGEISASCGGSITISDDCVVNGGNGGIVALANGTITFDGSHITNCGTIDSCGGQLTIEDSCVQNFGALIDSVFNGIEADNGGKVTIDCSNVTSTGIIAAQDGGTICITYSCINNSGGTSGDGNGIAAYDGGSITIKDSDVTNTGFIRAFVPPGDDSTGGTIAIDDSTVHNAGGSITAIGAGAVVDLCNTTIDGGTLATDDTTCGTAGLIEIVSPAGDGSNTTIFNGVDSTVTVDAFVKVDAGAALELLGQIDNNGTIDVDGPPLTGADLVIDGTVALCGSGVVTLQNSGDEITGTNCGTLENFSSIVGSGQIGSGDNSLTLINECSGVINADNALDGSLVIDTGCIAVTNNGTLEANAGTLIVESNVVGCGDAVITGGGTADFQGLFNQDVNFCGPNAGTLELGHAYCGTLSGFGADDAVDLANIGYSSGEHACWSQENGVLSIYDGATLQETIKLDGCYVQTDFTVVDAAGNTEIVGVPTGTSSADNYVWVGPVSGSWDVAGNWQDTTAGQDPALVVPGINDNVTINAAGGDALQVITGVGNSASLTIDGATDLSGYFTTGNLLVNGGQLFELDGTLTVTGDAGMGTDDPLAPFPYSTIFTLDSGALTVDGMLTVAGDDSQFTLNGGALTVNGFELAFTGVQDTIVINSGTLTTTNLLAGYVDTFTVFTGGTLSVTGDVMNSIGGQTYNIEGGTFTVQGTFTSSDSAILAQGGGQVQLAGLAIASDLETTDGVTLIADESSSIEIGTAGGAAAGSITVDSGVTTTVSGSFSGLNIVDNGTIDVLAGGTLTLDGSLGGSGAINVCSGASLVVENFGGQAAAATAPTITFEGTGDTLTVDSSALNASGDFVPTLSGFNASDVIDYKGTVTSACYDSGDGILTLYDGASAVVFITIGSGYAGDTFNVTTDHSGGTDVALAVPPGTVSADHYIWNSAIAGSWDAASNWDDTTAGQNPADVAPGINDIVTIDAAGGGSTHVITGVGDAASLTINGPTLLAGQFTTGSLSLHGSIILDAGDSLGVSGAATASGSTLTVDAGGLTVGEALSLSSSSLNISGGTAATIGGDLDSYDSSVDVSGGGSLTISGDYAATIYDSVTVNDGTMTVDGSVGTSGGNFTLQVENGGTLSITDNLTGGLNSSPFSTNSGLNVSVLSNSTLTVGDNINLSSSEDDVFTINGGTLTAGGIVGTTSDNADFIIKNGGKLTVTGNDTAEHASYQINDGTFTVGGTLTTDSTSISVSHDGVVQLAAVGGSGSLDLTVDGTSSLEIGTAGGAAAGSITIDSGLTVTTTGSFTAPQIIDNGTLDVTAGGGLTLNGSLSDSGQINIGSGSNLTVDGALGGSGQVNIGSGGDLTVEGAAATSTGPISFQGIGDVLTLYSSALNGSDALTPTLSGFNASDAIDFHGTVTSASYNSVDGVLTLIDGASVVALLTIGSGYAGDAFTTTPIDGGSVTQIVDPPAVTATIANGGSLVVNTASSEIIDFTGGTGTLVLDQPQSFNGQIVGFTGTAPDAAHSDAIDLAGINYDSSHFLEVYNTSTDILTVSDGAHTAYLAFEDFQGTFEFASDGKGGTIILDPPAAGAKDASAAVTTAAGNDHVTVQAHQNGTDHVASPANAAAFGGVQLSAATVDLHNGDATPATNQLAPPTGVLALDSGHVAGATGEAAFGGDQVAFGNSSEADAGVVTNGSNGGVTQTLLSSLLNVLTDNTSPTAGAVPNVPVLDSAHVTDSTIVDGSGAANGADTSSVPPTTPANERAVAPVTITSSPPAASSTLASATFGASGNESFAFHPNLGSETAQNTGGAANELAHNNVQIAGPALASIAPEFHQEFAFDAIHQDDTHLAANLDQLHQMAASSTLLH